MKTIPSLLIAALFATLTFAVWAYLNRPTREPPWPARIQGFAFSPFRAGEDPNRLQMPTDAEIDADLSLLEGKVNAVGAHRVDLALEQREVRVDLGIGRHLQAVRVLASAKRREGESLDARRPGRLARRAVQIRPHRERQRREQRRDQQARDRFHGLSMRLPAAGVGHRLPRFGGRERRTLLQQLDGDVVR